MKRNPSGHKKTSDKILVEQTLQGKDSFEKLVKRHQAKVYSAVFQLLRNHSDAEDITQEAFIRAYRKLSQYDPKYRFSSWITKISINLAIDFLKKRKNSPVPLDLVPEPGSRAGKDNGKVPLIPLKRILMTVDRLRPAYRTPFILYHMEKMKYDEIAEVLDTSVGNVKNYLFRARRSMRKLLSRQIRLSKGS